MPHRLDEFRAKIQFVAHAAMPSQIRKAAIATGKPSNTVYIQHALCRALARDLGLDYEDLIAALPPPRGPASSLFGRSQRAGETPQDIEKALGQL
jgi:hypothetical protein